MNIVGGINLPKSADTSDLYIQCNEAASLNYQEDDKKIVLRQGGILSSNSYFNSFYEKFYTKYTTLSSIYYLLKLEGDFKVTVYREVNGENNKEIISQDNFENCQFSESVKIPPINLLQDENAGRIYFEITCSSEQGAFKEAWIATDENKTRDVSLGIIICTFKKEDYIKNTLTAIFQDKLLETKDFKVFVVDNGRTLNEADFTQPKLKLVPNINAGGSGGFTRGLVEALAENTSSHFLLMDDDIELESQCIYRLFSLHEYAKTDFAVAGGLLNLEKKHMLYEAGATYNEDSKTRGFAPGSLTAANHNIDLRSSSSLNRLLVEEHIDYGGFWFFSFSKDVVEKIQLPLPLFIKIDDIEFCLRIKELGNKIVAFPSLAVWHQPASAKKLNWETYYYIRNDLITYAIHYSIDYMDTVQHFTKVILESLSSFDYNHAEMVIKSFEDYIKGPGFLKNADPEAFHVNILKLSKSYNNQNEIDKLAGTHLLTRWFKVAAESSSEWSSVSREWKSASKELTSIIFWRQYLGLNN
ncbi:glycosyltransferase family 2 protein [Trichocoleus sp. FACHB-90]|uniref:glycosyltransferase family 2 protein n=1 Tax=Cyanophyceae TaxID=3028117 RepID=UPI001686B017|nr:glycosyltransferase family 2 protein [Trichocoleus sp. FACHB-90]MBD1928170.1 glycosyltransferase family 2 protein [Trichocoleus sp. FACHB-90]